VRGTKAGDVLRTDGMDQGVVQALRAIAGEGSDLHARHRIHLDIVSPGVPMLPAEPLWHPLQLDLERFDVRVLDVHDVVVSKLKRWNAGDRDDARAMVEGGHVDRDRLVARFRSVTERYRFDGRADLLPVMARRLDQVERDGFALPETGFSSPAEWFR